MTVAIDAPKSPARSRKKMMRTAVCRKWDFARNMKKGAGVRQTRRTENLSNIVSMVEELDLEEVNIFEPSCSAFTALFMQNDNMRAWNDFINHTEEDQQNILKQSKQNHEEQQVVEELDNSFETVEIVDAEKDGREACPAFSGDECFHRIDRKLRSFLHKKHVPMGTLEHLEEDLMSFFQEYPTSVLVTKLGTSFERLLLHALCQYLDLSSHSYDDHESGGRHTEVENRQQHFSPPSETLAQYLEQFH